MSDEHEEGECVHEADSVEAVTEDIDRLTLLDLRQQEYVPWIAAWTSCCCGCDLACRHGRRTHPVGSEQAVLQAIARPESSHM